MFKFEKSTTIPEEQEEESNSNKTNNSSNQELNSAEPCSKSENVSEVKCQSASQSGDADNELKRRQSDSKDGACKEESGKEMKTDYEMDLRDSR